MLPSRSFPSGGSVPDPDDDEVYVYRRVAIVSPTCSTTAGANSGPHWPSCGVLTTGI